MAAATPYVLTWRHEGGNLFVGVNGVESAGTASGNTSTLTDTLAFGGKIFELASFPTVPLVGRPEDHHRQLQKLDRRLIVGFGP